MVYDQVGRDSLKEAPNRTNEGRPLQNNCSAFCSKLLIGRFLRYMTAAQRFFLSLSRPNRISHFVMFEDNPNSDTPSDVTCTILVNYGPYFQKVRTNMIVHCIVTVDDMLFQSNFLWMEQSWRMRKFAVYNRLTVSPSKPPLNDGVWRSPDGVVRLRSVRFKWPNSYFWSEPAVLVPYSGHNRD